MGKRRRGLTRDKERSYSSVVCGNQGGNAEFFSSLRQNVTGDFFIADGIRKKLYGKRLKKRHTHSGLRKKYERRKNMNAAKNTVKIFWYNYRKQQEVNI